jgi:hypothetical protein
MFLSRVTNLAMDCVVLQIFGENTPLRCVAEKRVIDDESNILLVFKSAGVAEFCYCSSSFSL